MHRRSEHCIETNCEGFGSRLCCPPTTGSTRSFSSARPRLPAKPSRSPFLTHIDVTIVVRNSPALWEEDLPANLRSEKLLSPRHEEMVGLFGFPVGGCLPVDYQVNIYLAPASILVVICALGKDGPVRRNTIALGSRSRISVIGKNHWYSKGHRLLRCHHRGPLARPVMLFPFSLFLPWYSSIPRLSCPQH